MSNERHITEIFIDKDGYNKWPVTNFDNNNIGKKEEKKNISANNVQPNGYNEQNNSSSSTRTSLD